jgi:hypothetical protein
MLHNDEQDENFLGLDLGLFGHNSFGLIEFEQMSFVNE